MFRHSVRVGLVAVLLAPSAMAAPPRVAPSAVGVRICDASGPPRAVPPPPVSASPPPPPAQPLEPPPQADAAPPATQLPAGQWVYTEQYGWLWMPHAQTYTHVVPDASLAYMYVFYPNFGWRWVVAPWVLGMGLAPRWGTLGPARFAWYTRPWFRVGVPFRPFRGPGWGRPGFGGRGFGGHGFGGGFRHR